MKAKINKILLTIITCIIAISTVNAEENTNIVDFTKKGSISVTLEDKENNKYIENAEISLYHIANAKEENYNLAFEYTESLKSCETELKNLTDTNLTKDISKCITNEIPSIKQNTDNNGTVRFENLALGLYLVIQTNQVEEYSTIDPFLVMIPKVEDNKYIYDLKANPKTEIYQVIDLEVVKVWNTTDNNIPQSITIELYKEDILIDTITLNQDNNWSYKWERIAKSDEYKVLEINIPDGYTASYRQEGNKFIVTNTKTLVQTGMNFWIIEILTISGLILIITGIIFERKGNHE